MDRIFVRNISDHDCCPWIVFNILDIDIEDIGVIASSVNLGRELGMVKIAKRHISIHVDVWVRRNIDIFDIIEIRCTRIAFTGV